MSQKLPAGEDWPDLLATARDQTLSLDGSDPVPHGRLATTVEDECEVGQQTASDWIENAVAKDWLQQRGSDSSRRYAAPDGAGSLYDTSSLDQYLGSDMGVDTDQITAALDTAIDYYHSQLGDQERWLIEGKWGIDQATMDDLRIGYAPPENELPTALEDADIPVEAALRAGVIRSTAVTYVYEGDPDRDDPPRGLPDTLAELAAARAAGEIDAGDINLSAVLDAVQQERDLRLYAWWDARIVFPYRDDDGVARYLIARRTGQTDDVPGKYLKLANTKPWVDDSVVYEPIYGCGSVTDDDALILTEGITDAIRAHEAGYACISPVTKQFKREHYDILREYAEQASTAYLCFDSEESGIGLDGALRTAWYLQDNDVDARVAELPRGDREEKVDLAEYLVDHDADDLRAVLKDARGPMLHPEFDVETHTDTSWTTLLEAAGDEDEPAASHDALLATLTSSFDVDEGVVTRWIDRAVDTEDLDEAGDGHYETGSETDEATNTTSGQSGGRQSALFDLTIDDVASRVGIEQGYRGKNPFRHWGDSTNYFVYETYKGERRVRDFKADYTYTPLTLLLVAAGERDPRDPGGRLSDEEIWEAWAYAKQKGILGGTDPIPWRARLHIARDHDLAPRDLVDSASDEPSILPRTVHNRILETVEDEHGVNPGKDAFDTDHKAERRAAHLEADDEDGDKGQQVKRMLATLDELDS